MQRSKERMGIISRRPGRPSLAGVGHNITPLRYRRYVETRSRSQKERGFQATLAVEGSFSVPLDYVSCLLTIFSTILVGRRCWEGWVLAAVNSVIICVIGLRTQQFGFIPANVFCLVLYGVNLRTWRKVDS